MSDDTKMKNENKNFWWTKSVIYEAYVDKFAGTFKTLSEKLDYLDFLGINTLWLLPFYPSPMIDGGYDISDYTSIRSELGSMEDFENFIERANKKNIRVLADLVLNHTSDKHPWFTEASSSLSNPKRDWYLWSEDDKKFDQAFVHFGNIKKNNWIKNEKTNDFYYASFYPQQPDLNWDNEQVYDAMLDVAKFWLGKGVSGFRLDAVSRLVKRDHTNCFALPETHKILKRMYSDLKNEYPDTVFVAESGGWPDEAKTFFGEDDECQVVLNFPLATQLVASISDQDTAGPLKVWDQSKGIGEQNRWGIFLTNHDSIGIFFLDDEDRKKKLTIDGMLVNRFGEHDGNSFAARLFEICSGDKDRILWAFKQMLSFEGVPIIYYGEEIGMPNAEFENPPSDFREYVRGNFDWEAAERQKKDPESILNKVRELISVRTV